MDPYYVPPQKHGLSGGAKAFIVIFVLAVLGVAGYFLYRYFKKKKDKCSSDTDCGGPSQGRCVNGACVCQTGWTGAKCETPTIRYKCDGSSCVKCGAPTDPGCSYIDPCCHGAYAAPPLPTYKCDGSSCVKCGAPTDPGCSYIDPCCHGACAAPPLPTYKCDGSSCVKCGAPTDPGCSYIDPCCHGACAAPPSLTYKCVGTSCQKCPEGTTCPHTHPNCEGECRAPPPSFGYKCDGSSCVKCTSHEAACSYTQPGCGGGCAPPPPVATTIKLTDPPSVAHNQTSWAASTGWPVQSYIPSQQSSNLSDPITYNPAMVTKTGTGGGVLVENTWTNPAASGVRSYRNFVGVDSSDQMALSFLEGVKGSCWSAINEKFTSSPFKDAVLTPPEPGVAPALPSSALASDGTLTTDQIFNGVESTGADSCLFSQFVPVSNLKSPWGPGKWPSGYDPSDTTGINFDPSNGLKGEFGGFAAGPGTKGWAPNLGQGKSFVKTNDGKTVGNVWLGKDATEGNDALILDYWATKKNGVWSLPIMGGLVSSKKFASGRYEVVAKVDDMPGLIWAIWTFRAQWKASPYLSSCTALGPSTTCDVCTSCGGDKTWCSNKTNTTCQDAHVDCNKSESVKWDAAHSGDPLFLTTNDCDAAGLLGGMPSAQYLNHEIDIEIPSNAPQVIDVSTARGKAQSTKGGYTSNTMNMNAYRWTNSGGSGSYENLFAVKGELSDGTSKPSDDEKFIGDGKYHSYAFEWHTGGPGIKPIVSFYFDGDYVGSTDAFVPNLASRLWIGQWHHPPNNHGLSPWAGPLDSAALEATLAANAPGTVSSDKTHVLYARTYIKSIKITPYNEANDASFDGAQDQPNQNAAYSKFPSCCRLATQPFKATGLDMSFTPNPEFGQCVPYGYKKAPTKEPRSLGSCDDGSAPTSQTFIPYYSTSDAKALGMMGMVPQVS